MNPKSINNAEMINTEHHLRCFRLVCRHEEEGLVEAMLKAQGYEFSSEPYYDKARCLIREPFPLGASLAARFGYIYIQDPSSMLPPLALAPSPGSSVLDICASPGSKTGLLAQLVGSTGFVLGNEPSVKRLATLRSNLETLNLLQTSTINNSGEKIPMPNGSWDLVLLDPPCSGWGTVDKNPKVLELWTGGKVLPLIGLQRMLLREAERLLKPGGRVAYSTCTTNVEENEEQVRWAMDELGLSPIPLDAMSGFDFADPECGLDGVLRVSENSRRGQGFFIALMEKQSNVVSIDHESSNPSPYFACDFIDKRFLDSPLFDISLLPDGEVAAMGSHLWFFPKNALGLIPQNLHWRSFPLGKVFAAQNGKIIPGAGRGVIAPDHRISPWLRAVMPKVKDAVTRGAAVLDIDEPERIILLLSGQSIGVSTKNSEVGLYFRGLPLCKLRAHNGRALLAK